MTQPGQQPNKDQQIREELYRRFSTRGMWRLKIQRSLAGFSWLFFVQILSQVKRLVDIVVSFPLFIILLPLMMLAGLIARSGGGGLRRIRKVGRYCDLFNLYTIVPGNNPISKLLQALGINKLPILFNIVRGELSFVGPRALAPEDISMRERAIRRRFNVRPGIIGPWWIRKRANIDYGSEIETDVEYNETQTLKGDIGIALRAIPAILYGEGVATAPESLTIQDIPINNLTMTDTLEQLSVMMQDPTPKQVVFVNAHCANVAYKDASYLRTLQEAALSLADGIGLKLAGKLLRRDIKQNVNGTDLFPRLVEAMEGTGQGLYLLGAREGIPETVVDWVNRNYPDMLISGFQHGYYKPEQEAEVIQNIRNSGAKLLLVAFGVPRQDVWLRQHLLELNVPVVMGVGGLFDFYSGRISRAPQWVREIGFEWAYRLAMEPGRMWKRYVVGNVVFLYHVMLEKMNFKRRNVAI